MGKFSFKITKKDKESRARAGIITTPHGKIETPAFSPVATRATVRALSIEDLIETGSQVILGNTYHLYLRPGEKIIKKFSGFAPFMRWSGPTITDSGGYQVSFLWEKAKEKTQEDFGRVVKIDDFGVEFSSHIDGSKHLLTPERSMEIQAILGADIIMAFDQPLGSLQSNKQKQEAFRRTLLWEERSYKAWEKAKEKNIQGKHQALFGIIQGETDSNLRRGSLQFLLQYDFPGLAVGGESIGSDPVVTAQALDTIVDLLPPQKPLHALGLGGGPEGIFAAISRGVDLFDNTGITRMARTGILFVYPEDGGRKENKFRIDITKSVYKDEQKPISKICKCSVCRVYSRAYIHHLLASQELLGFRLASLHNVFFINDLMKKIRTAITRSDFDDLEKHWLGVKL